jgi:hypothetical protein
VTTNAGNAQRHGPNPSDNTGAANGEEEMIPTTEDKRADPRTHSPYVAENENSGDVAVDGFWRNGRRCIFDVVSRTQSAEQPGIWIHSRFSEDVSGSKKTEKTHVICTEADEPQARAAFLIEGSNGELFKRAAVPRRIYW